MTSKERNELARLVKARFRLLRAQARARAWEIVTAEQQARELEAEKESRVFRDRLDEINARAKPLYDEAQDVVREADEAGFAWHGSLGGTMVTSVRFSQKDKPGRFRAHESVEKAVVIEIDRVELAVLEELLLGELESDDAKEFLGKIPTIQGLTDKKEILELIEA